VRRRHLRELAHDLLEHLARAPGVVDRKMAITQVIPGPGGPGFLKYLAEWLQGLAEAILQEQARAQKAHELDLRGVLEQRRASELLRRAKVATLERAPSGGELPLQQFRICPQRMGA